MMMRGAKFVLVGCESRIVVLPYLGYHRVCFQFMLCLVKFVCLAYVGYRKALSSLCWVSQSLFSLFGARKVFVPLILDLAKLS